MSPRKVEVSWHVKRRSVSYLGALYEIKMLFGASIIVATTVIFAPSIPKRDSNDGRIRASSDSWASHQITLAYEQLEKQKPSDAFEFLANAYECDRNAPGLQEAFEACFRLKIDLAEDEDKNSCEAKLGGCSQADQVMGSKSMHVIEDRMGLASLLIDQEKYDQSASQLRFVVNELFSSLSKCKDKGTEKESKQRLFDKASAMLYRVDASACQWDTIDKDSSLLMASLDRHALKCSEGRCNELPPMHPFEALKWPCISLENATYVAKKYADEAMRSLPKTNGSIVSKKAEVCSQDRHQLFVSQQDVYKALASLGKSKVRIGYISPDFTGVHPLAFLMQSVFKMHHRKYFEVYLYSLTPDDNSPEVRNCRDGAVMWRELTSGQMSCDEMASMICADHLDVMVDLCGHAGTMAVADIMARRVAPVQISYMGFPGSSGSSYIDWLLCDATVVPPSVRHIRKHYTERLIVMPHCYFVNSHRSVIKELQRTQAELRAARSELGLPTNGVIFCCHSRADKIDGQAFRSWLRALKMIRKSGKNRTTPREAAVLWLLSSGTEMERNLRAIAEVEFGLPPSVLCFCRVISRSNHLKRIGLSHVFLDTPSYNAHTLGCDALYAGVPMISLLMPDLCDMQEVNQELKTIQTQKLASRVGASLLKAAGLGELIARSLEEYETLMVRCATDVEWFERVKGALVKSSSSCPLYDTKRWITNFETGILATVSVALPPSNSDVIVVETK